MNLLASSFSSYQIMHRSGYTVTKYPKDEKTHRAISNRMFKRLSYITVQLYEMELVKSEFEHDEPNIVGFFILHHATMRMTELYFNFVGKNCDITKFEEYEMHTDSNSLALAEHDFYECIRPAIEKSGTLCEVQTVRLNFQPIQRQFSSLLFGALSIRSTTNGIFTYWKKDSAANEWSVCVPKHIAATTLNQRKSK